MKRIQIRLLLLIILLIITSVCILNAYSDNVMTDLKNNIVRLHVVASSDNTDDQALKLKVRDSIVAYTNEVLADCDNSGDAYDTLNENISEIEKIAKDTVVKEGYDYDVKAMLGIFEFPTKDYGNIILPNGEYTSLKIIIGEGEGQNWWCVLFPPLCFVNANVDDKISSTGEKKLKDEVSDDSYNVIEKPAKGIKFKFKIVEVIENAKMKINAKLQKSGFRYGFLK